MSQPYRCPVCSGRGRVALGFYDDVAPNTLLYGHEPCRTCEDGVLWGPPDGDDNPPVGALVYPASPDPDSSAVPNVCPQTTTAPWTTKWAGSGYSSVSSGSINLGHA